MTTHYRPASAFSVEALAALYTQTFVGYAYASTVSAADLAAFCRIEQIDLFRSPVLCDDSEPVGLATLGLRADLAYCKGFGVIPSHRGRGLSLDLCQEMIRQARLAGARSLSLGVMQQNERAVRTYKRAGMQVERDLLSWEWTRTLSPNSPPLPSAQLTAQSTQGDPVAEAAASLVRTESTDVLDCSPHELLAHFAALHPTRPLWSRDLPSLLPRTHLAGAAIWAAGQPAAYVLFERSAPDVINIADLAAPELLLGASLLRALQRQCTRITCHNEPAGSPALAALQAAGFRQTMQRYEMAMSLA